MKQPEIYSLIKCKPIQGVKWDYNQHHGYPHYHIIGQVDDGTQYTLVINIESRDQATPALKYLIDTNFTHPITSAMTDYFKDSYAIIHPDENSGLALDYVREKLFDPSSMSIESIAADGEDSLNETIDDYVQKAITEGADVYVFGFEYFDDTQGNGVHDVHMNQGNEDNFRSEDHIYQDGAFMINYNGSWIAMFFCFQSQSFNTDDQGHSLDSSNDSDNENY